MPVYEYQCETCGKVTEALRRMQEADSPIPCEHCGAEQTHRTHSLFAAGGESREAAMPDLSKLTPQQRTWLNQSCSKSLGPSLYRSCVIRERAALTGRFC